MRPARVKEKGPDKWYCLERMVNTEFVVYTGPRQAMINMADVYNMGNNDNKYRAESSRVFDKKGNDDEERVDLKKTKRLKYRKKT